MTINLHIPTAFENMRPTITVVGVGGAGGNAVNNMIEANLEGISFVVANTDAQALDNARTDRVIQLGANITQGLGAGASPDIGRAAAEEAYDEIMGHISGSHMVFITAGMGGGTGTGAAPVVARMAKEMGVLTVAVVTKPFHFEGTHRMKLAEAGLEELQKYVDTMIVIPNQNLFRIANEKTTFADAFRMADEVLHSGVRGVTDLMIMPGLINLDFADIRAVMREMGKAMMGTGEAHGERRAVEAAEAAISNPLLDDVSMKGARGVLINITGGSDMTLFEVDEAANRIRDEVDPDANIIFGSTFNEALQGRMRISVVATGIDQHQFQQRKDTPSSSSSNSRQEESNRTSRFSQRPEMMSSGFAPKVTTSQTQEAESATYNNSQREESRHFTPPASVVAENQPVEAAVPSPAPAQGVRGVRSMGRHSPTRLETARSASEQADDYYTPQPAVSAAPLMQQPNVTETRPARGIRPTRASASHAQQPDLWQQAEDETQPSFFQRMTARFTTKEEEEQHQPSRRAEVVGTRQSAKPAMSQSEDYLEIPAFLRRQAN